MRPQYAVLALLLLASPGILAGQPGVLRIEVTLPDESGAAAPVARYRLLISDNPATGEPRRVLTGADGRVQVTLPPGNYTVESDRPMVRLGTAYLWTQMVDVAAGGEATLELTARNAELVALPAPDAPGAPAAAEDDPTLMLAKWEPSLVAVWTPTARATGFVLDGQGVIATDGVAVGRAAVVAVQVSPVLKVPARVLVSDAARGVALVWAHPEALRAHPPVPMACPPSGAALDEGQEIVVLTWPLRGSPDAVPGEVTALGTRAVETDLRLPFGGAGGPVLNATSTIAGLSFARPAADPRRPAEVAVARAGIICELLAAARAAMAAAAPPEASPLPMEPRRSDRPPAAVPAGAPPMLSSADFDVALLTPPMIDRALQKAGWTGGAGGRSPELEARLGRLTDFGPWSEYFADVPPVLIVRVTPKLEEGFWKRVLREAARTQGAVLPPFKDFSTSFLRLQATCGTTPVTPVHPFVIEHAVSNTRVVREGLYVFDPAAFGPACGSVTLSLYGEKEPEPPSTLAVPAAVLEQIRQEFQ